jgi:hypothetical protein
VWFTQHQGRKHPNNPVLKPELPWEGWRTEIFGNVIYDEEEKLFKMWYSAPAWSNGFRPWCYAVSRDGYHWEKPELGFQEYNGSRRNNVIAAFDTKIDLTYTNVVKTSRDPDPQRRYKAMGELENGPVANTYGGAAVAFSPEGLHWTSWKDNPVIKHGPNLADAPTMFGWDQWKKKYVAYPRPGHPLAKEINGNGVHRHIRTIGYAESDDFLHWTPTRVMLAPGEEDRVDYQFGQFTAGICGSFYVGLLMVHQTHEQTWGVFLLSSRDGFHWTWIDRHSPFLLRGEVGSYDAGYQSVSGPITHNGKIWIYYGAFNGAHSEVVTRLGPNRTTIALATLPEDRWVGMLAGPDQAALVTRPIIFSGSRLFVDIDASVPQSTPGARRNFDECEFRAAVTDQSGGRIEGFTFDRSKVLLASGRQEVTWEGKDVGRLEGKPVRLHFEYRNAALYSIQFT